MKKHSIETIQRMATNHPFWSKVAVGDTSSCWPWKGSTDKDGYGYEGRFRCHRVAWELFNRCDLPRGAVVRHATCDNPPCCNPLHLEKGTAIQNVSDRVQRERSARGQANGRAILSPVEALSIYHSPSTRAQTARRFGVSSHTVVDIKTGRTWGWLTGHRIPTVGSAVGKAAVYPSMTVAETQSKQ